MKKIRIIHCALVCVFIGSLNQNLQAQTFDWAKNQGGTSSDVAMDIVTDNAGNVYTTGYFSGTVDFDPSGAVLNLTSAGLQDIFISKLDATGSLVWVHRFGSVNTDVANGIALDPFGNILITGGFYSVFDVDPGPGVFNLGNATGSDIYILKLTTDATFVWAKQFGGNNDNQLGNKITTDADGNVYSTGQSIGSIDFDPGPGTAMKGAAGTTNTNFYVSKLDVNGNYVWAQAMGTTGSGGYGLDIAVSSTNQVYSCGYYFGSIDFDPGAGSYAPTSSGGDAFVHKFDATGNFVWCKTVGAGNIGNDAFNSLVIANNNIFVAGYFVSTTDFDPGASVANMTSTGGADVVIESFDFNGNYLWVKKLGGAAEDWAQSISTDGFGGIYTTGFFTGTADFDPGAGTASLVAVGLRDVFISKLNLSGAYQWAQQIGGTGTDTGTGIDIGANGSVYTTGYYSAAGDFDNTAGITTLTNAGSNDIFTHKMSQCLIPNAPVNTTVNLQTLCNNSSNVLSVNGFGTIGWYSASTGGTYLGGGSTLTTPNLTTSTTYYVQDSICGASSRTSIVVNVFPAVINQTYTAAQSNICPGASTTINTISSETGVDYMLLDAADNEIAGPVAGSGSGLSFNTGPLSATTTYKVIAKNLISSNGALNLDGTNDYVDLGTNNRTITSTITVSAKVRTTVTGTSQFVVSKYLSASLGYYIVVTATGQATFQGRDISGSIKTSGNSTTMVADNEWHELTGVVRSTGWEIWVDGVLESSGAYSLGATGLATTAPLLVGSFGTAYSPMDIDQLAMWNTALNSTQILANTTNCLEGNEANLVALYKFNETSGSVSSDVSSTGINGTLTNMTSPACWIIGSALCSEYCSTELTPSVTVNVSSIPSQPSITASGSTTICSTGSVTLTASVGTTYLWSTGETTSSITVNSANNYTVQVTNATGCQSVASAATVVTIIASPSQPTISAGGPTTFCAGGSVTLTSSAGTSYFWSNGATTASISPTTSGTYTVQVTNASGCQSVASSGTTVTVNTAPAQPTISAGGSTTFCTGGSVTLTSSAGTSYLWSTGATTAAISPTTSGTYTVQVTNAGGCQSVASTGTTVTVNTLPSQPTISAGGPTTFCTGGTVTLTSSAGTSYLWSTGATTASISPATSGTYTVQVTNAAGCQSSASSGTAITVNALPTQPTISAGGPTTFCTGGSVTLTSSAGTSYLWSNGATTAAISPTTSGTYTVQITNVSGCQSVASAGTVVTVNTLPAQPTITAGGSTTFCQGGSVTLSSSAGSSYLWSDGSMSPSINPSSSGTYSVQITNTAGCQSVASTPTTVTVNSLPATPTITAGGPTTFCDGGSVTLSSSAGTTYLWSTGATTASISPTASGTFTVQVTNAAGCQSSASVGTNVIVNSNPVISNGTLTNPTSCTIDNGSIQVNGSGTGNISWSGASSGTLTGVTLPSTISGLGDGSYTITFTNSNGCNSNILNASLAAPSAPAAPTVSAGGSLTFCDGFSVTLTSSTGSTYNWSTGETTQSIVVTDGGNYSVSITDASGCSSLSSVSTSVTVYPLPLITLGTLTNPSSCTVSDGSIEIVGSSTGDLEWTGTAAGTLTGTTLPTTVSSLANGSYNFTFTDALGCVSTVLNTSLTLPSAPPAPTVTSSGSTTICEGEVVTLSSSVGDFYLWSNGETTQSIDVTDGGNYTVIITDAAGCTSPASTATVIVVNAIPVASTTVSGITLSASPSSASYQWIDCNNSNQVISGATSQTYTPTVNGNYAVIVTQNNCSDTSDCVVINSVGIETASSLVNIRLQPNPTFNELTIISENAIERVEIYTSAGELVQVENSKSFTVSNLSTGVYFVKVYTLNGINTLRLIKN